MGGFRLAGMKNPSSSETGLALFTLYPSGVKISYVMPVLKKNNSRIATRRRHRTNRKTQRRRH
jgi:hypothetical protein